MHVVLYQPEIPQNTGNIARTCAVTGTSLHLIRPLGFSLEEKHVKRAGLDYWQHLDLHVHDSLEDLWGLYPGRSFYYVSTRGTKAYSSVSFDSGDFIVFGRETAGLPAALLEAEADKSLRIPMGEGLRSLNLANSVALVLYEALRQQGFPGLR